MIIFEDRRKLSSILQKFLDMEIDSYAVEDSIFWSNDMLVRELSYEVELHLDEGKKSYCEHPVLRKIIERFVVILDSDFEFSEDYRPRMPVDKNWIVRIGKILLNLVQNNLCAISALRGNPFWPLSSKDDWDVFANKHRSNSEKNKSTFF